MSSSFRKFWFLVCLWLACICVFTASNNLLRVCAQSAAGVEARVTSVSGAATLSGNGRSAARLGRGSVLVPGHEINTQGGGRVVIDLSDGSQVVVLPGSRLVVGDYRTANSLRELLQITLGRIRVRINHFKNKPNPYRIKSPTASIAVRGTEFEVTVESQGETRVVVFDGAVEVAGLNDPNKPLLAEPGRGVIVRADFTLDFFVSGLNSRDAEENKAGSVSSAVIPNNINIVLNSQPAANVYERFTEKIFESGETALPSRFTAFADAHLDSLENPAYAGAFTDPSGQINFLSSFSDVNAGDELNDANPVDYGVALQGTFFAPLKRFGVVLGASGSFVNNGLQSFSRSRETPLSNLQSFSGSISSQLGTTNNKFFDGSLIIAGKFGSRDQTSIGFSYERLTSNGNLHANINQTSAGETTENEFISSSFRVNRRRVTVGAKHDYGNFKLGLFYRYAQNTVGNSNSAGNFADFISRRNSTDSDGDTSEVGFRLRGAISRRFFFGTEGTLLLGRSREEFQSSEAVDSMQRSATNRGSLAFGLGYLLRPRTIFSIDVAGGLINTDRSRRENPTGNLLENNSRRARYLSLHAAAQTDVWRNLFVSASILSLTNWETNDSTLFPDRFGRRLNAAGVFTPDGRFSDSTTDFYSNYGIGWRFKPNFTAQYILTTDYGRTAPRHGFLFRYNFDFSRK